MGSRRLIVRILDWLAVRLLESNRVDDPVWFMGRPYTPEQLDEIDKTYTTGGV